MLGGQKERREQVACSGKEDATMDKIRKTISESRSYMKMPKYTKCQHQCTVVVSCSGRCQNEVYTDSAKISRSQPSFTRSGYLHARIVTSVSV